MFPPGPNGGNGYRGLTTEEAPTRNTSGTIPLSLIKATILFEANLRLAFQLGRKHRAANCRRACLVREALFHPAYPINIRDLVIINPGDQLSADGLKTSVPGTGKTRTSLDHVLTAR